MALVQPRALTEAPNRVTEQCVERKNFENLLLLNHVNAQFEALNHVSAQFEVLNHVNAPFEVLNRGNLQFACVNARY